MAQGLNPTTTTVRDLCAAALEDSGYLGVGMNALGDDIVGAWKRLQWMLENWARQRWMCFHLVNIGVTSTGAQSYSVGPGGDYDTGTGSVRPNAIKSAFIRQLQYSPGNQVDTPLEILQSREDYDKIALKSLVSYPGAVFLDTGWPLATLHVYPIPSPGIYAVYCTFMCQLPNSFANLNAEFNIPFEYYRAIQSNLALAVRAWKQIGTFPGDELPRIAKSSLDVIKGVNTQIARLRVPNITTGGSDYNIFSDRF